MRLLFCAVFLLGIAVRTPAAPVPSLICGDHMVLQRDRPVTIRGSSPPGEMVSVSIAGQTTSGAADDRGRWAVTLPPVPAGGPYEMRISGNGSEKVVKDVLFGDVWLCSGQSNMGFPVREEAGADLEIPASRNDQIRFFNVSPKASLVPLEDLDPSAQKSGWRPCDPSTSGDLSAVAYHFAKTVQPLAGVPVGLIVAAWGGTPVGSWTPPAVLEAFDFAKPWIVAREEAEKKIAAEPGIFVNGPEVMLQTKAGTLFDGMIRPLAPLALRGILWYQGEQNAGAGAESYTPVLAGMVSAWRETLGSPDAKFYYVQLPNFSDRHEGSWPKTREAQMRCLEIPLSGMAVAIDQGESQEIHPRTKEQIGRRLARIALAKDYGLTLPAYSGPLYDGFQIEGAAIRVRFIHTRGGLVSKNGGELREFEVAAADGRFLPAQASIDGDSVWVWNPDITTPVAVRYAWKNDPNVNVFSRCGLPAAPFRTDDWPAAEASTWRVPEGFR